MEADANRHQEASRHQQELSLRRLGAATRNHAVCSWCEEEVEGTLDGLCQLCNLKSANFDTLLEKLATERTQEQRDALNESRGKL